MNRSSVIIVIICCLFFIKPLYSQTNGIGATLGGGYISGDSPDIGSFNFTIFADFDIGFSPVVNPRVTFVYAVDVEQIVPATRNDYYPFIKAFSLKGIFKQALEKNYYVEEGIGAIYMNDRTFSSTNSWNTGVVFSLAFGLDFSGSYKQGFLVGAGTEYAFAFSGTFPKYFSIFVQSKYLF